jgi:hypothetical protein
MASALRVCVIYFEIFLRFWSRVHMHSVFGNFIKVGLRAFISINRYLLRFDRYRSVCLRAAIYFIALIVQC